MEALPRLLADQLQALSLAEVTAVIAAVLYLLLAIRQSIWCWFFAAVSTGIYIVLFIAAKLYMESLLNAFYLVMAVYGWYVWRGGLHKGREAPVVRWPLRLHAAAVAIIGLLSFVAGHLLARHTDAAFPHADSLTTFAAVWTTFLVARKVLENWWYWLVIDTVSVCLYWARDLPLTALLFVVYLLMIPFGIVAWTRAMHTQRAAAAS